MFVMMTNENIKIIIYLLFFLNLTSTTVVFKKRQNPKTYEKQKAERFYILFSPVRVYVILQGLSTMILRKIN